MRTLTSNFIKRRKEFINKLPENSIVIIPNKSTLIRSNDVEYKFKPDSDFYYLTGFEEPNSICVLKKEKRSYSYLLFVEERDKEKEIWTGKRAGVQGAKALYKANEAYLISEFEDQIKRLIPGTENIYFPLGKFKDLDFKFLRIHEELKTSNRSGVRVPRAISDPRDIIHKMRLIKDNYEISCIKRAASISSNAHIMAMTCARSGMYEYELEALIEYRFRIQGGIGPAYPSIVGSGKNSTILHYTYNNRRIQKNDLVLIDAGCEYDYYASDLTRTFPVSKKFDNLQRDIYQIVYEAQLSAIELVKPQKRFIDSYNKAVLVLVEGLKELGLLKGSIHEIVKKKKYKRFFMHRLGHWLGLDVHDAGPYVDSKGNSIKLKPGMVMTVEPGIYISNRLENIPSKYYGIGVRIEDDVLVTNNGNLVLTNGVPKSIREIENFG